MRHGIRLAGAKAASIGLYDQRAERFAEWVTQGLSATFVQRLEATPGELVNRCFGSDTYILSNDRPATRCPLNQRERDEGIKCYICLPLTSHARHLGVINLYLTEREDFLPDEIELLVTFGHLAAGAIETSRLYASMSELAARDMLTGLYNRRMLEQRLAEETQRALRYSKPYSVLMLDIDRFKTINDTYGHPVGDAVLQSLARTLLKEVRDIDTAARFGGEEFVIILPETEGLDGTFLADRLRTAIAQTPIALSAGWELSITVSIGVASYPHCADTSQLVIERADQALYVAKQSGRNRVCFYGDMLKTQLEKDPSRIIELLNQDRRNITAVATAADAKAACFHNHAEMVDEYAAHLGNTLGLTAEDLKNLHDAALLHDVGLITVPDTVVQKTAVLGQQEQQLMRRHPIIMADILEQTTDFKPLAPVVRHHHEHFDGSGYPDGLKGEAIPYLSRILTVVDAYTAMISQRPHRPLLTPAAACRILEREAGKQFDPHMVRAFVQLIESGLLPA
jgi:diguanylate cyclase (GGDEF)-like protein